MAAPLEVKAVGRMNFIPLEQQHLKESSGGGGGGTLLQPNRCCKDMAGPCQLLWVKGGLYTLSCANGIWKWGLGRKLGPARF